MNKNTNAPASMPDLKRMMRKLIFRLQEAAACPHVGRGLCDSCRTSCKRDAHDAARLLNRKRKNPPQAAPAAPAAV